MSQRSRACDFQRKVRERIIQRDDGCIFCQMGYMPNTSGGPAWYSIMHYIPRSHGGLGIEENGAVGCQWHHDMLDNGNVGNREEMLELFKSYLQEHYKNWDEEKLIYKKWR